MADAAGIAHAALALGTATLGESEARRIHPRIKPGWPGARLAAPVCPVRCSPGDNLAIHVAVARASEGCAIVADMGAARDHGHWGELLTTPPQARQSVCLVIRVP